MSPRSREEVAEMIGEWISDLNSLEGSPLIIVEGKRDLSSLAELGIGAEATSLNLGLSLPDLAGSIHDGRGPFKGKSYDMMIILTDWDKRGGRLAQSLKDACTNSGLRYDLDFRRRISVIAGRWVKDVESLPSLLRNMDGGLSLDVGDHPDGVPPGP